MLQPFFHIKIYSRLDQCQGAVHGLNGGTDDILLKAFIDPFISLSWVSNWGDGNRPQVCRFLYNLSSCHAYKRTLQWGRNKDLWFSLARSLLAPLQSGCKVQHQPRCGARNMTLDRWCGSGDWGGEGGSERSTTSNHWFGWNADSKVVNAALLLSLTVSIGGGCMIYHLSILFRFLSLIGNAQKSLDFIIWVKGEGWPAIRL